MKEDESLFQISLFEWVEMKRLTDWRYRAVFSYPIGGFRHTRTAARIKKEGAKKGAFDIFCLVPAQGKNGLFLELKVGKNKLTKEQLEFQALMTRLNYQCAEARTFERATQILEQWIRSSTSKTIFAGS